MAFKFLTYADGFCIFRELCGLNDISLDCNLPVTRFSHLSLLLLSDLS